MEVTLEDCLTYKYILDFTEYVMNSEKVYNIDLTINCLMEKIQKIILTNPNVFKLHLNCSYTSLREQINRKCNNLFPQIKYIEYNLSNHKFGSEFWKDSPYQNGLILNKLGSLDNIINQINLDSGVKLEYLERLIKNIKNNKITGLLRLAECYNDEKSLIKNKIKAYCIYMYLKNLMKDTNGEFEKKYHYYEREAIIISMWRYSTFYEDDIKISSDDLNYLVNNNSLVSKELLLYDPKIIDFPNISFVINYFENDSPDLLKDKFNKLLNQINNKSLDIESVDEIIKDLNIIKKNITNYNGSYYVIDTYDFYDIDEKILKIIEGANDNNILSCFLIGRIYACGKIAEPNKFKAIYWLEKVIELANFCDEIYIQKANEILFILKSTTN
jgi:hypothetical protein